MTCWEDKRCPQLLKIVSFRLVLLELTLLLKIFIVLSIRNDFSDAVIRF